MKTYQFEMTYLEANFALGALEVILSHFEDGDPEPLQIIRRETKALKDRLETWTNNHRKEALAEDGVDAVKHKVASAFAESFHI